jgi:hydroxymethylbilane synthase
MNRPIRIGTRDSELAMWQAHTVKEQLETLGYQTHLIPVKSTGDLMLDQPLYELGITGIFTKTLDMAMLKGEIDVAVHSMKDVPTALPKGIVQAAVLERGPTIDLLVYKHNEEFLARPGAVIATGSLRRQAQWLNRYPSHSVVDLRGNVNTRLEKLEKQSWNGAIFAAAGLNRLGLEPGNTIGLSWMIPAPAQGAMVVMAMEEDEELRGVLALLNHRETEICTSVERRFLSLLEGGCTAPIGALATIDGDNITLKGILLTRDGSKKLETEKTLPLSQYHNLASECAEHILIRGGKRLMSELQESTRSAKIFSTKNLTAGQLQLFKDGLVVQAEDFLKVSPNRISPNVLKNPIENVVITSQNAVEALLTSAPKEELKFKNIYCVGRRTKRLIENRLGKVKHNANSAKKLADYLVEYMEGLEVTFFCGDQRMDDLPTILAENRIVVNEIEAYKTKYSPVKVPASVEGVMFYSPSTVASYLLENKPDKIAFCIGDTTANAAQAHFSDVRVAKMPSIESVIALVNETYMAIQK